MNPNEQKNRPGFSISSRTVVDIGSWIAGMGLILLGVHCFFIRASEGYGVAPVNENGYAYVIAAAMRDLALGLITIYLYLKHRRSLTVYFLCLTIIPIADTLIVLRYGNSVWNLAPHVIGIVGLLIIAFGAYRENVEES